jgi:hypothetical protein
MVISLPTSINNHHRTIKTTVTIHFEQPGYALVENPAPLVSVNILFVVGDAAKFQHSV